MWSSILNAHYFKILQTLLSSSSVCWFCEAGWQNLPLQSVAPVVHQEAWSAGTRWRYVTLFACCRFCEHNTCFDHGPELQDNWPRLYVYCLHIVIAIVSQSVPRLSVKYCNYACIQSRVLLPRFNWTRESRGEFPRIAHARKDRLFRNL